MENNKQILARKKLLSEEELTLLRQFYSPDELKAESIDNLKAIWLESPELISETFNSGDKEDISLIKSILFAYPNEIKKEMLQKFHLESSFEKALN